MQDSILYIKNLSKLFGKTIVKHHFTTIINEFQNYIRQANRLPNDERVVRSNMLHHQFRETVEAFIETYLLPPKLSLSARVENLLKLKNQPPVFSETRPQRVTSSVIGTCLFSQDQFFNAVAFFLNQPKLSSSKHMVQLQKCMAVKKSFKECLSIAQARTNYLLKIMKKYKHEQYSTMLCAELMNFIPLPELWNEYTLVRYLGGGAFGQAFLIQHKTTGQVRVIKFTSETKPPEKGSFNLSLRAETAVQSVFADHGVAPRAHAYYEVLVGKRELHAVVMDRVDTTIEQFLTYPVGTGDNMVSITDINTVATKLVELIQKLHVASLTHGDMHTGNIGIVYGDDGRSIEKLLLIDTGQATVKFSHPVLEMEQFLRVLVNFDMYPYAYVFYKKLSEYAKTVSPKWELVGDENTFLKLKDSYARRMHLPKRRIDTILKEHNIVVQNKVTSKKNKSKNKKRKSKRKQ